jgi:multidrug efflux system outer membrane protein
MPIFDARLWSALRVTKAERQIAIAQYEQAIQSAFREVADALAVLGTVADQVTAQELVVAANQETYRLSAKRYEKGLDSYLSVLDAQRSLYLAQRVLVALNLQAKVNRMQLYAALGGGAI